MEWLPWAGWAIAALGALAQLVSGVRRQSLEELQRLANTRRDHIEVQDNKIEELEARIAALEAQHKALVELKAIEVGDHVVTRLIEMRAV